MERKKLEKKKEKKEKRKEKHTVMWYLPGTAIQRMDRKEILNSPLNKSLILAFKIRGGQETVHIASK